MIKQRYLTKLSPWGNYSHSPLGGVMEDNPQSTTYTVQLLLWKSLEHLNDLEGCPNTFGNIVYIYS